MLRMLIAIDSGADAILRMIVVFASAVVTLCLVGLVICRYVFGISLMAAHEASLFAAMWLYMCGAVLASRRNEHLVVDILASNLTGRMKLAHQLVISVLTVVISSFFIFWVWKMLAWGLKRPQVIPGLDLPLWAAQAPIALAAIASLLYGLRDIIRTALALYQTSKES